MPTLSSKEKRKLDRKFPIRWLTYKQRIVLDIERAFKSPAAKNAFPPDFIQNLTKSIERSEGWIIKLFSFQFSITAFFILGFISDKPSLSLLGISLTDVVGLKEVLLAIWTMLGAINAIIGTSRDTLVLVADEVFARQQGNNELLPLAKLSLPASFNIRVYTPREFDDWLFSTWSAKTLFAVLTTLATLIFFSVLIFSFLFSLYVFRDIYNHPTLGSWSYTLLIFSGIVYVFTLLWVLRFGLPLPYRDKSGFKRIAELEHTDPIAYRAAIGRFFEES